MSKKVLTILILFLTAAGILACGEAANIATAVNGTVTAPASTPVTHFKVGQQVKVGDTWVITVNSIKTASQGLNELDTPKAGNIFLVIDVTQKNISSQQQFANASFDWTLRDSTGQSYDQALAGVKLSTRQINSGTLVAGFHSREVVLRARVLLSPGGRNPPHPNRRR